ncbi:MAG: NADH-quinone oxidoreductase subunit J family protein [Acidimicrobiia bacterium]
MTLLAEATGANVAFWIIAAVMAAAAIAVVTVPNVVHAALSLVVVLAGVAAQYILLQAEFVGLVQVLIYIGAVIILFLFGIMLTRSPMKRNIELDNNQRLAAGAVAALILVVLTVRLFDSFGGIDIDLAQAAAANDTSAVADSIFRVYVVAFEVVSMLLLAALVGAIVLARKD